MTHVRVADLLGETVFALLQQTGGCAAQKEKRSYQTWNPKFSTSENGRVRSGGGCRWIISAGGIMHEGVIPYTDYCTPCEHLAVRVSDGWDKLPNLIPVAGSISHIHTFKKEKKEGECSRVLCASYKTLICKILNKLSGEMVSRMSALQR